jgi:putative hydrolase of the HAD superfamily
MADTSLPEALILDFGGVLYDIDYDAPVKAFRALGLSDFAGLYHQASQSPAFDELECGQITPDAFYSFLEGHCRKETLREEVVTAWNSILTGMPACRIPLVQSLSSQTRLFIFSNTNVIHAHVFESWIEKNLGLSAFRGAFEAIHYSHELGQRKPKPDAFLALCRQHRLNPSNTLFVDDSEQHVSGAKRAGLQTHWHNPVSNDIAIWLAKRGFDLPEGAFRSV